MSNPAMSIVQFTFSDFASRDGFYFVKHVDGSLVGEETWLND